MCVLIRLLQFMLDNGHEVFRSSRNAVLFQDRLAEIVHAKYPETEEHLPEEQREGRVPRGIRQMLEAQAADKAAGVVGDGRAVGWARRPLAVRLPW